jgi:hypothetical protein
VQPGCTKAHAMLKDKSHDVIEKLLSGSSEASDLVYTVIEQALVVGTGMLGSDRSRGLLPGIYLCRFRSRARLLLENAQKKIRRTAANILLLAMAQDVGARNRHRAAPEVFNSSGRVDALAAECVYQGWWKERCCEIELRPR